MKILVCLIYLVNYSYCQSAKSYSMAYSTSGIPKQDKDGRHHNNADGIVRPCAKNDIDCIRRFFANNFLCTPAYGPVPEPYIFDSVPLELPFCNVTLTIINSYLYGLNNGYIEQFYINEKTGGLIFEVQFDNLVVKTPITLATYHFKGREPVELTDYSSVKFRPMSMTLHVSKFRDLNCAKYRIFTYWADAKQPYLTVGPAFKEVKDPAVRRMNKDWMEGMTLSVKEAYLTQGPAYMSAYMNSNICNFGRII